MTEFLSGLTGLDLPILSWCLLLLAGAGVGLSKTAIPGGGILAVVLTAMALPSRMSVGVLLPMLIFGDFFAIGKYRPHIDRKQLVTLLPFALIGLGGGYVILRYASNEQLKPIIGAAVLAMLALQQVNARLKKRREGLSASAASRPISPVVTAIFGVLSGMGTGMANAAGPILSLYLLIAGLPKLQFIATSSGFFFILNLLKVPLFASLGIITTQSLRIDLLALPSVLAGALLGFWLVKRIPQEVFNRIVVALAFVAAVKLLIG